MIESARPVVGSLGLDGQHGPSPQAPGTRLPDVSKVDVPYVGRVHAGTTSWEPCVCGGVIFAGDRSIEDAVAGHALEVRHLLWRIDELERQLERVRVDHLVERPGRVYE